MILKEPNENPQRAHLGPRAPLWTTLRNSIYVHTHAARKWNCWEFRCAIPLLVEIQRECPAPLRRSARVPLAFRLRSARVPLALRILWIGLNSWSTCWKVSWRRQPSSDRPTTATLLTKARYSNKVVIRRATWQRLNFVL